MTEETEDLLTIEGTDYVCDIASELTFINSLLNKKVRVGRGGPESKTGYLLGINPDYLVLWADNGEIIYYQTLHAQSVTLDSTNTQEYDIESNGELPIFALGDSFVSTIDELKHNKVQVNRGGPDCLNGVIVENNDDYFTLAVGEEIIFIFTHHVKSLSLSTKNDNKDNEDNKDNKDNKDKK